MTNTISDSEKEFEEANKELIRRRNENKISQPESFLSDAEKLIKKMNQDIEDVKIKRLAKLRESAVKCNFCDKYPTDEELLKHNSFLSDYECRCELSENHRQELRKQREIEEKKQKIIKITEIINERLPKRFANCTFDNYIGSEQLKNKLKLAAKNKESILLSGSVGSGKTHLAVAYLREFLINNGSYIFMITYIAEMIDSIFKNSDNLEKVQNVDLLLIDDLGAESVKDWGLEKIFDVVNFRYMELLPVIVTTNLNSKELSNKIGQRSFSRLLEMCKPFEVKGEDYRIKKLKI